MDAGPEAALHLHSSGQLGNEKCHPNYGSHIYVPTPFFLIFPTWNDLI